MVSIIVPVYKVEKFLPKCIESVLNQTYTDFELILVDDGSPDKSPEICDKYAELDKRVVVIHQKNAGVSAARNAGLENAKGEYIGFVDPDDWIAPKMYEQMIFAMEGSNADLAICGYDYYDEDYHVDEQRRYKVRSNEVVDQREIMNRFSDMPPSIRHGVCNKLFKNNLLHTQRFINRYTYKFPANITNCSNNYGPYQFPEKLIPLIINNALQGKKLPVYGDGKNVRDWLYVEDHAKGIDMVQEKGRLFETYNIGGHNEKQNIEIIHIILDTLQEMLPAGDSRKELVSEQLITYVEDRKGHDRRYAIAPDKIKEEVGWVPDTMFEEGIRLTIKWFFENEEWMKNVTSGDYQKYYEEMYK